MEDNTVKTALSYLKLGFSVIPLKGSWYSKGTNIEDRLKDSKAPLLPSWKPYQFRQPSPSELNPWFRKWPKANIAIITGRVSGIVVVDFDSEEAIEWAKRQGILKTAVVKTGKGIHAYYKYPDKGDIGNSVDSGAKIDIRAEGGYVVAPPSTHLTGSLYVWITPIEEGLAPLPDVFLLKTARRSADFKEYYNGVNQGGRNDALARLCGSWTNHGLTIKDCLENAHIWNSNNNPPMGADEVERTVKSIYRKHLMGDNTTQLFYHEKNFLRFPVSTHSKALIHKPEEISVVYSSKESERKWSVIPSAKWGIPGPFDEAVFMAVNKIISDKPKPLNNPVDLCSLKEMAKMLNYSVSGHALKLIKESLLRLKSLTITTEKTYYDASTRKYLMDSFNIFDRIMFTGEIDEEGEKIKTVRVWLSSVYLKNINSSYLSAVDYDLYISLGNNLARGIYRSLSPIMSTTKSMPIKISYGKLIQKLQIAEEKYLSDIKKQLGDAHKVLISKNVFSKISYIVQATGKVVIVYSAAAILPSR